MEYYKEQFRDLYERHDIGRIYKVPFDKFISDLTTITKALEGQGERSSAQLFLILKSTYDVSKKAIFK